MMKKYLWLALMFVISCAPKVEQDFGAPTANELADLKYEGAPERTKDRVDVYESMARAVKYNVGAVAQATNDKIFSPVDPKSVLLGIENAKTEDENPLFRAMKALDYAILFAVSNLSSDSGYIGEALYKKSAENLSLAAIKAHKGALYALKENKIVNKLSTQESKQLKALDERFERKGKLSDEELEYKKGLEVGMLRINNIKSAFIQDVTTYAKLAHVNEVDKMRLEGRKFYELEDFDKQYSIELFQKSAAVNRLEFQIGSDFGGDYSFAEIQDAIFKKYPEVARLRINGYDIKSDLYVNELQKRAFLVANELVAETKKYIGAMDQKQKQITRRKAYDEMAIAIFTQVEIAFNLVQKTDFELKDTEYQIKEVRKHKKELEKRFSLNAEQKVELLNLKILETELEMKKSQIMAERAMAIRAVYFYAGLDPFSKNLIHSDINSIEKNLRLSFNKDMVEMLAAVPNKEPVKTQMKNVWADQQNWLEEVVEAPKNEPKKVIEMVEKPHGIWDPYEGAKFDKLQNMQLGSYQKRESADVEWSYLKDLYPEFANQTPVIEKAMVNGKTFYRMMLHSPTGGWVDLCNRLRRDKVECILR